MDVTNAERCYYHALCSKDEYFQRGLLIRDETEHFYNAVCLRQLKCFVKLIKYAIDEDLYKQELFRRANKVNDKLIAETRDDTVKFQIKASFFIALAEFAALKYKLGESDQVKNSIHYFCKGIDIEEECGLIRYLWLLSLDGLAEVCPQQTKRRF